MMTTQAHEAAAVHLLQAMKRGGSTGARIQRLVESLVASGEPDGPNVGALFAFADADTTLALLTMFGGWQRHGMPDALDQFRMRQAQAAEEMDRERSAARAVGDMREAAGDVVRYRPD